MKVSRTVDELRTQLRTERTSEHTIGFVPTMGALHDGHLSLIRAARVKTDVVVVSIFVNPLQFGPDEDFHAYPRDEGADLGLAEEAGADLAFIPEVDEMYPEGDATTVAAGPLGTILEGEDRPGHFDGVCTVVAKLFNIVEPDVAFFGQKDAQQVAVIKRMVADLRFGLALEIGETVREPDGVALSSRNAYLSSEERAKAKALYEALQAGRQHAAAGELERAEKVMWEHMSGHGLQPSYARVVDPDTFAPASPDGRRLLVVAVLLGRTRLIDNMLV